MKTFKITLKVKSDEIEDWMELEDIVTKIFGKEDIDVEDIDIREV